MRKEKAKKGGNIKEKKGKIIVKLKFEVKS
jgi:hypothetical protein